MNPRLSLQCVLAISLFGTLFSEGLTYVELFGSSAISRREEALEHAGLEA